MSSLFREARCWSLAVVGMPRFRRRKASDGRVGRHEHVVARYQDPAGFKGRGAHPPVGKKGELPVAEAFGGGSKRHQAHVGDTDVWRSRSVPSSGSPGVLCSTAGVAGLECSRAKPNFLLAPGHHPNGSGTHDPSDASHRPHRANKRLGWLRYRGCHKKSRFLKLALASTSKPTAHPNAATLAIPR